MSELDIVRNLAREVLAIPTLSGELDNSLWDRAQRLVRNAEYICRLPELADTAAAIDRFCLTAAAYFSDAGLAQQFKSHQGVLSIAPSDLDSGDLLDSSAQLASQKLTGVLEPARIQKIGRVITECGDRLTRMTEAMVLSDARNLDDMGAVGIFNESKRCVVVGKGASDALQSWQKKVDYRYWQARLNEGFRFAQVRRIAEDRLAAAERYMDQLKVETEALDLEGLAVEASE